MVTPKQFKKLSPEQLEMFKTIQARYKKKRPVPSKVAILTERFGPFTVCVLFVGKRVFTGASKLNHKDLVEAVCSKRVLNQKTGDQFALNNAFRNYLAVPARNWRVPEKAIHWVS